MYHHQSPDHPRPPLPRLDAVQTVRYDGSDHRVVLKDHAYLEHPFAVSVFGNHVYWTDWKTNSVIK